MLRVSALTFIVFATGEHVLNRPPLEYMKHSLLQLAVNNANSPLGDSDPVSEIHTQDAMHQEKKYQDNVDEQKGVQEGNVPQEETVTQHGDLVTGLFSFFALPKQPIVRMSHNAITSIDYAADSSIDFKDTKTIIWLHGAAGSATMYSNMYQQGQFPKQKHWNLKFLQSPHRYTDFMGRASGYAWMRKDDDRRYLDADIQSSAAGIASIVRDEINKYETLTNDASSKVYLAGFSQGAMMTLYVQMSRLREPLGGAGVFEGSLVPQLKLLTYKNVTSGEAQEKCSICTSENKDNLRYFMYHGTDDLRFHLNATMKKYKKLFKKNGPLYRRDSC